MRILIHAINFSPELTGCGKYTGEMAEWLAGEGHEVRVVTAPPYYPDWRVWSGYSSVSYRHERHERHEGLRVWRCPLWVPRRPGSLARIIHLASFALSSLPVMLCQVFWRAELVIVVAPTILCAPAAWLAARFSGSPCWLHVQDFELDVAMGLAGVGRSQTRRITGRIERYLMRRFDVVSTISERMLSRLADKGVDPESRALFPNWVDTGSIFPLDGPSPMRQELGIGMDQVVVLYAGNMGRKQGLEILIEAARALEGDSSITFVLAGAGAAREELEEAARELTNIRWLPLQPIERLNQLLNLADIHVLPQRADAADLVMPSKLTGMLASGRAVVATAAPGTQVARVVEPCGEVVSPGSSQELAGALRALAVDEARRQELGRKARDYAVDALGQHSVLAGFVSRARELVNHGRP
ncbi:glycosyltransferase WbuB [Ectothiorhodospiraceae bacterium WFHF3C12]|nr:glycosyltransferase WbuB [Ectothiorhodospiraceae bacterium WFHF3C12]